MEMYGNNENTTYSFAGKRITQIDLTIEYYQIMIKEAMIMNDKNLVNLLKSQLDTILK